MRSKNYYKAIFYSLLLIIFILAVIPDINELPEITKFSDKFNHFIAFFTLALLIDLSYSYKSLSWKISLLIFYELLIEFIQYFLPHREFSLFDLLADFAGLLLFFLIMRGLRKLNSSYHVR